MLTARTRALEKVANEIDYAILEATSKHAQSASSATFNFYGQVGVVLTGPGATATVAITADQRQTIVGALNAIQEVVMRAPELAPLHRTQVAELVAEAKAEAQKEQANGFKLRGILSGVGMAVQTLGSARGVQPAQGRRSADWSASAVRCDAADCGTDCGTRQRRTHAHHGMPLGTRPHIRLSGRDLQ